MAERAHVVWIQYDPGGPWHMCERPARWGKQLPPLTEEQAVREAAQCRASGLNAKALPLGTKPEAK